MNAVAAALRAAILEQPGDPLRWKVYADWLEEHGHPAAASTREFANSVEEEDGLIARCIELNTAALEVGGPEHIALCAQAASESAEHAVSGLLHDWRHDILESDAFTSASATTNAERWRVEEVEVEHITWEEGACRAQCSYSASGEQIQDRILAGNAIAGTVTAVIDTDEAVSFEEVTAEVQYDCPEGGPYDAEAE